MVNEAIEDVVEREHSGHCGGLLLNQIARYGLNCYWLAELLLHGIWQTRLLVGRETHQTMLLPPCMKQPLHRLDCEGPKTKKTRRASEGRLYFQRTITTE